MSLLQAESPAAASKSLPHALEDVKKHHSLLPIPSLSLEQSSVVLNRVGREARVDRQQDWEKALGLAQPSLDRR